MLTEGEPNKKQGDLSKEPWEVQKMIVSGI